MSDYVIAELDGRPLGVMQIIDPHLETTHYWGEIEPKLRSIDIWIGDPSDRGRGLGARMMRLALARCFADPTVEAIVIDPVVTNTRAHAFYRRLGFVPLGVQRLSGEDCLIHRLDRAAWRSTFSGD